MPSRGERADHPVAVDAVGQLDDEHEPAAALGARVLAGQHEPLDPAQPLAVESAPRASRSASRASSALELRDADRRGDVGEPVVEAEPVVRRASPCRRRGPGCARCARCAATCGVAAGQHPALAGHELLVRVEGERRRVAARADPHARRRPRRRAPRRRPRRSRGRARAASALERLHVGRVAEQVHRQQPGGARPAGRGRGLRGRCSACARRCRRRPAPPPRRAGSWPTRRSSAGVVTTSSPAPQPSARTAR